MTGFPPGEPGPLPPGASPSNPLPAGAPPTGPPPLQPSQAPAPLPGQILPPQSPLQQAQSPLQQAQSPLQQAQSPLQQAQSPLQQPQEPKKDSPGRVLLLLGAFGIMMLVGAGLLVLLLRGSDSEVVSSQAPITTTELQQSGGETVPESGPASELENQGEDEGATGGIGSELEPAPGSKDDAPPSPEPVPPTVPLDEPAVVEIVGTPLPPMENSGLHSSPDNDPAIGLIAPSITGANFFGETLEVGPDGQAKVLIFLAHWCPHCQRELPQLVAMTENGLLPDGVELYAIATAVDPSRDNYPPQPWLERERWEFPVVRDSPNVELLQAFGGTGFPFAVYLDGENRVLARSVGSLSVQDTLAAWGLLAP